MATPSFCRDTRAVIKFTDALAAFPDLRVQVYYSNDAEHHSSSADYHWWVGFNVTCSAAGRDMLDFLEWMVQLATTSIQGLSSPEARTAVPFPELQLQTDIDSNWAWGILSGKGIDPALLASQMHTFYRAWQQPD